MMWLLKFLPDWFFYLILLGGILGNIAAWAFSFIPFISKYLLPIRVVSIVAVVVGLFMSGAIYNENVWQARVKELELKVAESEAKSAKENVKLVEKIVTKTQIVRVQGEEVIKYIDREIVKYDDKFAKGGQCEIPSEFYKALNNAAEDSRK